MTCISTFGRAPMSQLRGFTESCTDVNSAGHHLHTWASCCSARVARRAHRWSVSVKDSVEDADEQIGVPRVHNVLLQVRQQWHQLLRIPATCPQGT